MINCVTPVTTIATSCDAKKPPIGVDVDIIGPEIVPEKIPIPLRKIEFFRNLKRQRNEKILKNRDASSVLEKKIKIEIKSLQRVSTDSQDPKISFFRVRNFLVRIVQPSNPTFASLLRASSSL